MVKGGYREYKDNLARPAYSQDVTYPLTDGGPTQIRFKSVRIFRGLAG